MTNTLHRYGDAQSFVDDYVIFAIPCKGKNDEGAVEKLKTFLRICAKHTPSNMGNSDACSFQPSRRLGPDVHWQRDLKPDHESVIEGVHRSATVAAVFDSSKKAEACLRELIDANLGLSVNVSASVDGARELARSCSIDRHSVEYSLGFDDPQNLLPEGKVLELSTMCGHGMVSSNLARKMIDMVKEGRRSPKQAAATMARFCACGVYNPDRAKKLLEER
jgi:hypothetical protein